MVLRAWPRRDRAKPTSIERVLEVNPEIKAEWLSDLRSRKFKKGKGVLKELQIDGSYTHCCLGVLCEQAVRKGVIPPSTNNYGDTRFEEAAYILPYRVTEWAEIEEGNPLIPNPDPLHFINNFNEPPRWVSLSTINDTLTKEYSFADIADLIEQYL